VRRRLDVVQIDEVDLESIREVAHGVLLPSRPSGIEPEDLDACVLGADAVPVRLDVPPNRDGAGNALVVDLRELRAEGVHPVDPAVAGAAGRLMTLAHEVVRRPRAAVRANRSGLPHRVRPGGAEACVGHAPVPEDVHGRQQVWSRRSGSGGEAVVEVGHRGSDATSDSTAAGMLPNVPFGEVKDA
jgi:hypothetical protein